MAQVELATNQGCKALIPNSRMLDNQFAFHLICILKAELCSLAVGTTFAEISSSRLGDIFLPMPPLEVQHAINRKIAADVGEVDAAINIATEEITLIQQFRTRLIADVVTGQLDVRALAATLPTVTAAAPLDDMIDGDEADVDADALEDEEADA